MVIPCDRSSTKDQSILATRPLLAHLDAYTAPRLVGILTIIPAEDCQYMRMENPHRPDDGGALPSFGRACEGTRVTIEKKVSRSVNYEYPDLAPAPKDEAMVFKPG